MGVLQTTDIDIDLKFDEFFKTVDVDRIEKYDGKPFTPEHKERMRQSFIKHNGYPSIVDIWPELFDPKL